VVQARVLAAEHLVSLRTGAHLLFDTCEPLGDVAIGSILDQQLAIAVGRVDRQVVLFAQPAERVERIELRCVARSCGNEIGEEDLELER